jgi:glycerol-3-phosphate acyltransferase PlsY
VFANAPNENWFYILRFAALFCAVLGHIFPIFAGFRGGKGVATLVGGVVAVNAPLVLLCAGVWLIVLMISHYVSLASMVAGVCYPIFTLTSPKVGHLPPFIIFSLVVAVLLIYTHRKNIQRLKEGTENKIYVWKRKPKSEPAPQPIQEESIEEAIEDLVEEFKEDNQE